MIPPLLASTAPIGAPQMSPMVGVLLALFFVFLNGFFVAAEFALVKVRGTQLDPLVAQGDRRATIARHMVTHLDAYLSATQLGITLASLALGWIGEPAFGHLVEPLVRLIPGASDATVRTAGLLTSFLIITILHIVLGELAPKSFAIRKPKVSSLMAAYPLYFFYKMTFPAIWLLNHAANAFLKIFGVEPVSEGEMGHSEEEVRLLLASSQATDVSEEKRELLDNVFELSHRTARQVMVPRGEVVFLSTEDSLDENLKLARESGHTRFPLCEGGLDQVVGLVHIKDLFRYAPAEASLEAVRRDMPFLPETLTLDRLLARLRHEKVHMAAVLDEYGGVSGIVTLENVIEEIVGPIQDEFDAERPEIIQRAANLYEISGAMLIKDLEDELGLEVSHRHEDTIAGVVLSGLGRRARLGDETQVGPLTLRVVEVDGNRIQTLRVRVDPETADDDESN
jgi:CBS domain containing-hemolysin-like protein